MSKVSEMTHDEIADWGAKRLRNMGYKFAWSNLTSACHAEQPDVLGMNSWGKSIILEVKVSRSDFLADKKKTHRQEGKGIGETRVYLTPAGLLSSEEIPYGWELWEVYGKSAPRLRVVKGWVQKNVKTEWGERKQMVAQNSTNTELLYYRNDKKNCREELTWMLHMINRAMQDGVPFEKYANNYQREDK